MFIQNLMILLVGILMAVALYLFRNLTAEIKEGYLIFYFDSGFIRRKIKIADIVSAKSVRNPWYFGWGVRWFGRGWLYNVSGLDAVEVALRNGTVFRIGTDEPNKLENAIHQHQSILR